MSTITAHPVPHVPHYRLTRRGRLVVFLLGLVVALAVGILFAGGSVATAEKQETETLVVAPGETLWSIASEVSEGGDVIDTMAEIEDLNHLAGVDLASGQELVVPTR